MNRRTALTFALALARAGCSGNTGSKRFDFDAQIGGAASAPGGPLTFTNETGWTITLTKAKVTLGPVYLNVVPPLRDETQSVLDPLIDLFVRRAWAAGEGHLGEGRVVGEVLGQVTFDALSPALVAFPVQGSLAQEEIRTTEVWFYPKPGVSPDATKIDTVALDVAGEAARAESRVRFRGALILNDAWQPDQPAGTRGAQSIAQIRKVRGIPSTFFPAEGGHLEIRVDVAHLFRGADFSNLDANPADRDGTKLLVQSKAGKFTTDQVMTNLYQGLRAVDGTYAVRWVGP
jgi:hypothetical protein